MLSVPGAQTVGGYSFFGDSYVYVIFWEDTDMYCAKASVGVLSQVCAPSLPSNARRNWGQMQRGVGWVYLYALVDKNRSKTIWVNYVHCKTGSWSYELQTVPGVSLKLAAIWRPWLNSINVEC